jgi:ATP dependent DNA ligase domain
VAVCEIKHDGFRVIARKDGPRVRLYSRQGNDLSRRFPLIVEALRRLRSRSCIRPLFVATTASRRSTVSANTDGAQLAPRGAGHLDVPLSTSEATQAPWVDPV